MAEVIYTYQNPCSKSHLEKTKQILEDDGVIAYPSDVNWAFACLANKPKAVQKLRRFKPEKTASFSLVFKSIGDAAIYTHIDNTAYRLMRKILPGPYTIFIDKNIQVLRHFQDKRKKIGFRIPDCPLILELLEMLDFPLATTSIPDPTIRFGYEIDDQFGHGLDLILDLGEEQIWHETTILDISKVPFEVVRQGEGTVPKEFL